MTTSLLSLQGLTKAYPGVVANDQVSFDIGEGEVHALLGENGAGKSTLVKMIYGLVKPDSGTMLLRGYLRITCCSRAKYELCAMRAHACLFIIPQGTKALPG